MLTESQTKLLCMCFIHSISYENEDNETQPNFLKVYTSKCDFVVVVFSYDLFPYFCLYCCN